MIISCPNCSTTYKVDNATLGPQGKSVRCSNCEHQWHQLPVKAASVQQAQATGSQPQMQPAVMIDPNMLQAQIIAQMQALVATNQMPQLGQMNATVQPAQELTPKTKPEPKLEQLPEEDPPSQEELNSMFGEDEPDPPVSLMGEEEIVTDDGYNALDDIPDPDPIPESLMSKDAYDQDDEDEDDEDDEDDDDDD